MIKHPIFPLLLCAALVLGLPAAAQGTEAAAAKAASAAVSEILQTGKEANLRKQASTRSDLLERLRPGARVEVISRMDVDGEQWAFVRVVKSRREGYILERLLEPLPSPTPVPTATPTPAPTADASQEASPDAPNALDGETLLEQPSLARTTVRANLRRKPGGTKLLELKTNTLLTVLGEITDEDGALWLHIEDDQRHEGYLLAELTRQVQPAVLLSVPEEEIRERFPVVGFDPINAIKSIEPFTYTQEELAPYKTLRPGDRSKDVLRLRRRLYELGYYTKPNENTLYTKSTAEVIAMFQRASGLEPTGEADPQTQAMLYDSRTPAREGSPKEIHYLSNRTDTPVQILRTEVTSYSFYGSIQLSAENKTGGKLTRFGLKIIPYMSDGSPAHMASTFAEEIEREYSIKGLSIGRGNVYSDFETIDREEDGIWPHHFQVSRKVYFTGAQLAVSWYRSGGKNVYIDDDQLVFVEAGKGAGESFMHTLPIEVSDTERAEAAKWNMGLVTRYVLPAYQEYYHLPQGAWIKSIEEGSPAQDAGLEPGDVIVGIGDITILGDATLRKARASIAEGEPATLYFWRDGSYFATELLRPKEKE